jgi:hypothetical protein
MPDLFDLYASTPGADAPKDMFDVMAAPDPGDVPTIKHFGKPALEQRGSSITDIPGNAWKDITDLGPGLSAFGSLAKARIYEATPMGGFKPIVRPFDLSANEPSDFKTIGNLGMAIGNQYKQNYWDPMVQGRGTDIPKYWAQHPVTGFMADALPFIPIADTVGIPAKIAQGAGAVAAKAAPIVNKVAGATASVGAKALDAARESNHFGDIVTSLERAHQAARESKAFTGPLLDRITQEHRAIQGTLRPLWDAIPAEVQPHVSAFAEGWHPELIAHGPSAIPASVQSYLSAANSVSSVMQKQIEHLTPAAVMEANRYYPAGLHLSGIAPEEFVKLPKQMQNEFVQNARAQLDSKGITPQYSPWMKTREVQKILRDPTSLEEPAVKQGIKRAAGRAEEKPGFAREKASTGENFHGKHYEALQARYLQVQKYVGAYEAILERAIKNSKGTLTPELATELEAGTVKSVDAHSLYKKMVKATMGSFSEIEIASAVKALPRDLILPAPMADALESLGKSPNFFGQAGKIFGNVASAQRRFMLGFNPTYPEMQALQNLFMLGITQFKGVRDSFKSIGAFALAMSKDVRGMIPADIAADAIAQEANGLRLLDRLGPLGRAAENFIDANMQRMQVYDQATRMAAAVKIALDASEKSPELGGKIMRILTAAEAADRIKNVFANPILAETVAKEVNWVLGDFSAKNVNTGVMKAIRSGVLWASWYKTFGQFAMRLPANNPYKTLILTRLAQVAPDQFIDKRLPEWMQKAGYVALPGKTNAQGMPMYLGASSTNPLATLPEFFEMASAPFDTHTDSTIFAGMNVLVAIGIAGLAHKNPSSMRDFSDPRLVKFQGKQFERKDALAGDQSKAKHPVPNMVEFIARNVFSYPTATAERVFEKARSGGEKSQFTSVISNESAPKMKGRTGEVVKAPEWETLIGNTLVGIHPIPVDLDAEKQRRAFEPRTNMKLRQAAFRQLTQQSGN